MLNVWNDVKGWFNKSWSIFIARMEVLVGFLIGVFGGIDWSAIAQLDWYSAVYSKTNLLVAALIIIKGVVSEMGRRSGTVVSKTDQLIPVNIAEEKKIPLKK